MAPGHFSHNLLLIEWVRGRSPYLIGFVSLACEQNDIAILGDIDRALYRRKPVRNSLMVRSAHPRFDVVDDRVGVLGAGIVARHNGEISSQLCDLSHERTLAFVAIAAAPENHNQLASCKLASGAEASLQRVGGMRVVTQDSWMCGNHLEPSCDLGHRVQASGDCFG